MKHYAIRVTGKVQGVFFRASTQRQAERLNVKGFVRNEPDGSVYIEAEGLPDALEQFLNWCKHGPSGAVVKHCEVLEGHLKGFKEFEIRR
jgi:acylphosphatase